MRRSRPATLLQLVAYRAFKNAFAVFSNSDIKRQTDMLPPFPSPLVFQTPHYHHSFFRNK